MYRSLLLEFLSTNRSNLLENNYSQMTLVLFPYENNNLLKLDNQYSNTKVYHLKDHYTFLKEYDIANLQNTIIEMVLEYKEPIKINKNDISFEINDPYYLKDIRNQKFESIELLPIIDNDNLVGACLIYSNNQNASFNISNKKLLTLVNKIIQDEEIEEVNNITNNIIDNEKFFYVIKKNNSYYLNDECKKKYRFKNNLITEKDHDYLRLKKTLNIMKKIEKEDYEIYYISSTLIKKDTDDVDILLLDSINNHSLEDDFSVIYSKLLDEANSLQDQITKFNNALKKLFPDAITKFYKIDSTSIAIIIDRVLKKKDENDLRFILKKDYYVVMTTTTNITKKMNLINVMNYLNRFLLDSFDLNKYLEYEQSLSEEILEADKQLYRYNKIMIKADTLQTIGKMVNAPITDSYNQATYKMIDSEFVNLLEKVIKDNINSPIITLLIESLNKRKIYELLKKIINKEPNTKIIFHIPKINNYDTKYVFETIQKAKDMGFIVIIDSTFFMNFKYNVCLKIADAIIIRNNELDLSLTKNNIFNKKLFESFYEEGKVVIFEKIPNEDDIEIINELTCLLIDDLD